MKTKKMILISIVIIICIGYFGINYYLDVIDENNFEKAIKNASFIENSSDNEIQELFNKSDIRISEAIHDYNNTVNSIDKEIYILQNYSNHARNPIYKNYTDLEINRLYCEKMIYIYHIELLDISNDALSIKSDSYEALYDIVTINRNISGFKNDTLINKEVAQEYLDNNTNLKNQLISWNIDEDFIENRNESYITLNYVKG